MKLSVKKKTIIIFFIWDVSDTHPLALAFCEAEAAVADESDDDEPDARIIFFDDMVSSVAGDDWGCRSRMRRSHCKSQSIVRWASLQMSIQGKIEHGEQVETHRRFRFFMIQNFVISRKIVLRQCV